MTFALPKFTNINTQGKLATLKSQYTLLQNSINEYNTKQILLANSTEINSLDDALINKTDEKLFTKFLDINILATSKEVGKIGSWIKLSEVNYSFVLSSNETIDFTLENGIFKCFSDETLCRKVY